MVDSYDSFGSSRFPLSITVGGSPATSAAQYDPGADAMVAFFRAVIEADCGAAWRQLVGQLDETSFLNIIDAAPVGDSITVEPSPENLTQRKEGWPLLAVYREGEPLTKERTTEYQCRTQNWAVDWVIGPLGVDTQRRVGSFVVQIENAITAALWHGYHPAYQGGVKQFVGIFSEIEVLSSSGPGHSDTVGLDKKTGYFGGSLVIQTVERMTFQSGATQADFEHDT